MIVLDLWRLSHPDAPGAASQGTLAQCEEWRERDPMRTGEGYVLERVAACGCCGRHTLNGSTSDCITIYSNGATRCSDHHGRNPCAIEGCKRTRAAATYDNGSHYHADDQRSARSTGSDTCHRAPECAAPTMPSSPRPSGTAGATKASAAGVLAWTIGSTCSGTPWCARPVAAPRKATWIWPRLAASWGGNDPSGPGRPGELGLDASRRVWFDPVRRRPGKPGGCRGRGWRGMGGGKGQGRCRHRAAAQVQLPRRERMTGAGRASIRTADARASSFLAE